MDEDEDDYGNDEELQRDLQKAAAHLHRFGLIVKRERARRGWTADEASKMANVSPKTWQRIEEGSPVRTLTVSKLDTVFGLIEGTSVASYYRTKDLEEELEKQRARNAKLRDPMADRIGEASIPADPRPVERYPEVEAPEMTTSQEFIARRRKTMSDKDLIVNTIVRLTPYLDDWRVKESLRGLTMLGFAGIVNDWDIFDSNGNIALPVSNSFDNQGVADHADQPQDRE